MTEISRGGTPGKGAVQNSDSTQLKRVLRTKDLIFFSIMMMFPLAPVALYGQVQLMTGGNLFLAYLIAAVAMVFTALSYGAMTGAFPRAGSTYTFVRRGLNSYLGLVSGWTLLIDYTLFPAVNVIILGLFASAEWPQIPYWIWVLFGLVVIMVANIREVRWITRLSAIMFAVSIIVILWFVGAAAHTVSTGVGLGTLYSMKPIFNSTNFTWTAVFTGTSIAAFSFLGFDATTTLAEEVHKPQKSMAIALVTSVFIVLALFLVQVYFSVLLIPDPNTFVNPDISYFTIFAMAGGGLLAGVLTVALVANTLANGTDSIGGASRLIYGMGRDNVIPKKIFGYLWPKSQTPVFNVLIIIILTAVLATQDLTTILSVIDFGALFAFFLVNVAVINHYFIKGNKRDFRGVIRYLIAPGIGAGITAWLWVSLTHSAWIVGGIWLIVGVIWLLYKSNLFRKPLPEWNPVQTVVPSESDGTSKNGKTQE